MRSLRLALIALLLLVGSFAFSQATPPTSFTGTATWLGSTSQAFQMEGDGGFYANVWVHDANWIFMVCYQGEYCGPASYWGGGVDGKKVVRLEIDALSLWSGNSTEGCWQGMCVDSNAPWVPRPGYIPGQIQGLMVWEASKFYIPILTSPPPGGYIVILPVNFAGSLWGTEWMTGKQLFAFTVKGTGKMTLYGTPYPAGPGYPGVVVFQSVDVSYKGKAE